MCESLIQKLYNFFFQKRTSLTKYLISLLTRQFTPISNLREFLAYVFFKRRESCKNGQLFFLLPFLNPVRETVFHRREKLILLCCCALALLEMRGYRAATFNNGERIQSEVNGACIEPIHLFSRGLTKVSKYLSTSSIL